MVSGKSVLISRYGAYGDILHMSFLPRLFKSLGYTHVAVDTNQKGFQILGNNPFVDEFYSMDAIYADSFLLNKRWEVFQTRYDRFVNLYNSLEHSKLAMEGQNVYYTHDDIRRKLGAGNYYDVTLECVGFTELKGKYKADIFFSDDERAIVKKEMAQFDGKFKVMLNLNGSGLHKKLVCAEELVNWMRHNFDNVIILTTGDGMAAELDAKLRPDYSFIQKKAPFVQAMCTLNHMDCVIGTESGLMVASNALERPTIQLMTAASLENHPNGCKGDFGLQSPAYCSPCHKGPYRYIGCPTKDGLPLCVHFDINIIKERVNEIYSLWQSSRS